MWFLWKNTDNAVFIFLTPLLIPTLLIGEFQLPCIFFMMYCLIYRDLYSTQIYILCHSGYTVYGLCGEQTLSPLFAATLLFWLPAETPLDLPDTQKWVCGSLSRMEPIPGGGRRSYCCPLWHHKVSLSRIVSSFKRHTIKSLHISSLRQTCFLPL